MKGYKATDENGKCLNQQFKVGKTYEIKGDLKMCSNGFHFCENLLDVYNYYPKTIETRVFEVEAIGEIQKEQDKNCTSKIKIIKELDHSELLEFYMKHTNSGDWNSGDGNSGYGNSGNRNSGDWNSGDGNSGYFNTNIPVYFFNKPSDTAYTKEFENKIRSLNVKPILNWIYSDSMTNEEKQNNPSHKTTGGFLRKTNRFDWTKLTDLDKEFILSLPNYDDEVFKVISNGVSLLKTKTIKIIHEGKEFEIDIEKAKELGLIK